MSIKDIDELRKDPVVFAESVLDIRPFPYQEKFLRDPSRRIVVCAGRRVGKSVMTAARAVWFAVSNPRTTTLIVSATLRQSIMMFDTVIDDIIGSPQVSAMVIKQTHTLVRFSNGSKIKALPCGSSGKTLRGDTAHLIIIDEAAFVPEVVISEVVLPMLATTEGTAILLSTPFDKRHIFYKAFTSGKWSKYSYPTSMNPLVKQEFLDEQRELVGEQRFAQEYLAEFVDEVATYFPQALLRQCVHVCEKQDCEYCSSYGDLNKLAI